MYKKIILLLVIVFVCLMIQASYTNANKDNDILNEQKQIEKINKMNREKGYHWVAGKTSVSSLSDEEFTKLLGVRVANIPEEAKNVPVIRAPLDVELPESFDWRDFNVVTPVKEQLGCGACWAFAAVAQLESHMMIYDSLSNYPDLSEEQLNSCSRYGPCEGGMYWDAYRIFESPGAVSEVCMPYTGEGATCWYDTCEIQARISDYYVINPDVNSIKYAIYEYGPVWIAMTAVNKMKYYVGGCWDEDIQCNLTHAVLCVGWDDNMCDGEGAWIVKNSWGVDWGDSGYMYIKYNVCNFGLYATQINYIPRSATNFDVVSPNGKELIYSGNECEIKWHCSIPDIGYFKVGYYVGTEYFSLSDSVGKDEREYIWVVPDIYSNEVKVKVSVYDTNGIELTYDLSDKYFSIINETKSAWGSTGNIISENNGTSMLIEAIATDRQDNAVVLWSVDNILDRQLYIQKMDPFGNKVWINDVPLYDVENESCSDVEVVVDKNNNSLVCWNGGKSGSGLYKRIRVQKVDQDGNCLWGANGMLVSPSDFAQDAPHVVLSSSEGDIIVLWEEAREDNVARIYAQRINPNGDLCWGENGILVAESDLRQTNGVVCSDGSGGVFVAWTKVDDVFNSEDTTFYSYYDIYAQRIDSNGVRLWGNEGVEVAYVGDYKFNDLRIIPDNSGRAVVCWSYIPWPKMPPANDCKEPAWIHIYTQMIDGSGNILWQDGGIRISERASTKGYDVAVDGAGNTFVVWSEYDESASDIFAQKINFNGYKVWGEGDRGIIICGGYGNQQAPRITYDGRGGSIIFWDDDNEFDGYYNIYAQQVDEYGNNLWNEGGLLVLDTKMRTQLGDYLISKNHLESVYVLSNRHELGSSSTIVLQKVSGNFTPPPPCKVTWDIIDATNGDVVDSEILRGCPAGGWMGLRVNLDFDGGPVSATDIYVKTDSTLIFWGENTADSSATSSNEYKTTLTCRYISRKMPCIGGCKKCKPVDIVVYVNGYPISKIDGFDVKCADYTGDGVVDISDFSFYGQSYGKSIEDEMYNDCFDFNGDQEINLSDFSMFGSHYGHYYSASGYNMYYARNYPISEANIMFKIENDPKTEDNNMLIGVYLTNADQVSMVAVGLGIDNESLRYLGWRENRGLEFTSMVAPIENENESTLFIAVSGLQDVNSSEVKLGEIVFATDGVEEAANPELPLKFGEIMDSNGRIKLLKGVDFKKTPAYRDFLASNYPNPFNPTTTIEYSISKDSWVNLSIYNVNGQLVRTLVNEYQKSNKYKVVWDGKNNNGNQVSSGVYFYKIVTDGFVQSKKLIVLR